MRNTKVKACCVRPITYHRRVVSTTFHDGTASTNRRSPALLLCASPDTPLHSASIEPITGTVPGFLRTVRQIVVRPSKSSTTRSKDQPFAIRLKNPQLLEVSTDLGSELLMPPRSDPAGRCGSPASPPRSRNPRPPPLGRRRHNGPVSGSSRVLRSRPGLTTFTRPSTSRSSALGNRSCSQSAWRTKYRVRAAPRRLRPVRPRVSCVHC